MAHSIWLALGPLTTMSRLDEQALGVLENQVVFPQNGEDRAHMLELLGPRLVVD